jgi:hypothetical protein
MNPCDTTATPPDRRTFDLEERAMPLTLETAQAFIEQQLSALGVVTATLTTVDAVLGILIFCTVWGWCRTLTRQHARGLGGV